VRGSVEANAMVNPTRDKLLEWDEITEQAREDRRLQAMYSLKGFTLIRKNENEEEV
jgi:hypothetical protein